jgi:isoquinoline 1-oxidoreductase
MNDFTFQYDPDDIGLTFPTRRDFLKSVGGSLTILFLIGSRSAQAQRGGDYPEDVNAYLKILANGRITCFTGKIEMGQGIIISLAQMIAEELDVAFDTIDMIMGDTDLCPYDSGTVGSRTTKFFGPALRQAGASAKAILLQLAAKQLDAEQSQLFVENGIVSIKNKTSQKVSYADLVKGKNIKHQLEDHPDPEHYKKHTITGQAIQRTDALEKVTGAAKFAGDILLPNMLYAKVLRPPAHGATLISVDTSAAQKINGARIIEDGEFVAVLAEHPDVTETAFALIKSEFEKPADARNNATIFEHLEESATSERLVTENGDIETGRQKSDTVVEASYYNHYVAHAPLETHTAIADVKADKATLWISTQTPFRIKPEVAQTLEMPEENVRIITPFVGGGFGGKKSGQFIHDAARLSQKTGRPVQVMLSRKEEFFFDTFRPAAVIDAKSGIDKNGKTTFWDFSHLFPGTRSSEPIYNIPHFRVLSKSTNRGEPSAHPFGTGAWRGPGSNTNIFAMESQVDEMAHKAGLDPLSFRLKNLTDKRMIRVLEKAAEQFGHSFSPGPSGSGFGIACTNYLNTYVSTMAEVEVDKKTGHVRVKRIVCAQDMGEIINPLGARLQIEGGLIMGLGYCLSEEIEFTGGQVLTENFDTYEMTKFSWVPKIEAVLVENVDLAPQGCGEPSITTAGAVIANAVFDAIGVRLYTLPMTPRRILNALKS